MVSGNSEAGATNGRGFTNLKSEISNLKSIDLR